MLNDSLPNAAAAEWERMRRDTLCPSERADAISYDWARIGFGIVMAGGAYPIVLAAIFAVLGGAAFVWSVLTGNESPADIVATIANLFWMVLYALLGGLVGVLW